MAKRRKKRKRIRRTKVKRTPMVVWNGVLVPLEERTKRILMGTSVHSIPDALGFNRLERKIFELAQLYRDFLVKYLRYSTWYTIFKRGTDPRLQKRLWGTFRMLAELLNQLGIDPKEYFYFHFRISKRKPIHYFLTSMQNLMEFKKWEKHLKEQGTAPSGVMHFSRKDRLKTQPAQDYLENLRKRMKDLRCISEADYWLKIFPAEICHYPEWFLSSRKAYVRLYEKGQFEGMDVPKPRLVG